MTLPGYRRIARWLALHADFIVPNIVYQMGKVGSSAIVEAIARTGRPVFHVHRMDAGHLERMRDEREALGWLNPPIPPHDTLGLMLREKVIARGRPAKIITLVRDPIARNLSSYFEHLDAIWHTPDAHQAIPLDRLITGFFDRYPHRDPLTWFDEEMKPVLGIDLYDHPFPRDGHLTVRTDRFELLILKSEATQGVQQTALSLFMGSDIVVSEANATRFTRKGSVYAEFLSAIQFNPAYVGEMLNARYARHFYGEEEREALRHKYHRGHRPD